MDTGWWVGNLISSGRTAELASWVFWVIFSICLHELAHGWAALWQGDDTPRATGHMTINPLVHMGPWSLLAFALTGLAWGAMPVNPSRFRWGTRGDIVVSGAGPAMNFLLASIAVVAAGIALGLAWRSGNPSDTAIRVIDFFMDGAYLNIILGCMNLLPVPPLDGSHILSALSWRVSRFYSEPQVQSIGMLVLVIICFPIARGPIARGAEWLSYTAASGIAHWIAPT